MPTLRKLTEEQAIIEIELEHYAAVNHLMSEDEYSLCAAVMVQKHYDRYDAEQEKK